MGSGGGAMVGGVYELFETACAGGGADIDVAWVGVSGLDGTGGLLGISGILVCVSVSLDAFEGPPPAPGAVQILRL